MGFLAILPCSTLKRNMQTLQPFEKSKFHNLPTFSVASLANYASTCWLNCILLTLNPPCRATSCKASLQNDHNCFLNACWNCHQADSGYISWYQAKLAVSLMLSGHSGNSLFPRCIIFSFSPTTTLPVTWSLWFWYVICSRLIFSSIKANAQSWTNGGKKRQWWREIDLYTKGC